MTSSDFDEYFVLVIAVENTSLIGLEVSNITADNDNLYVELYQSDETDNIEENVISVKISKQQLRENIIFKVTGLQVQEDGYVPINEISKNYSIEQAIKDNCFVIENRNVKSANPNELIDFVENKVNNFIRIVDFDTEIKITDIEYKDGKYYINRLYLETGEITYKVCKEIIILRPKGLDNYTVFGEDEYTNQFYICSINN